MTSENEFLINFVSDLREDIRGIRSDIKEIMTKHDFKKDGYISYDEFRTIFYDMGWW